MDSLDPTFMAKPSQEEKVEDEEVDENKEDTSDVGVLLKIINILIDDFNTFNDPDRVPSTRKLKMPNN